MSTTGLRYHAAGSVSLSRGSEVRIDQAESAAIRRLAVPPRPKSALAVGWLLKSFRWAVTCHGTDGTDPPGKASSERVDLLDTDDTILGVYTLKALLAMC